jgi:hypothetical protein
LTADDDDAIVVVRMIGERFDMEAFETRLTHECGKLRSAVDDLRGEFRGEMRVLRRDLRGDMQQLRSDVRVDIANTRADLLKWSFLFWVGQVAAVLGLVTLFR